MVAAKKLYPKAKLVLPTKQAKSVERFLAIYRDSLNFYSPYQIDWKMITEVIMVDIASLHRIGEVGHLLNKDKVEFIIYDHHQPHDDNVTAKHSSIDYVGATVTLLVEEIIQHDISISSFEATIFALGLYTDTGAFTYSTTTSRDLQAASYLLEVGANLQLVSKFSESPLQAEEQKLLQSLIEQSEEHYFEGVDVLIAVHQQKQYTCGLSLLAKKALEMTGTDALIFVVEMGKRTFIIGRSTSDRIDVLPIIKHFGGGGHPKAASAMVKNGEFQTILTTINTLLPEIIKPSLTAKNMMSSPVRVISTTTSIDDAAKMMLRYGHTGFPVLENGKIIGIISRRDIDKAKHHGLGHAPVKGYMSTELITIHPNMSIEEIQNVMIEKNVGRLPVIENGQLIGIISRTNVIEALHGVKIGISLPIARINRIEISLIERMDKLLSSEIITLLKNIGKHADKLDYQVFIIGGIVRDLVIGRKNEDIDIVVQGDGIAFAKSLSESLGGNVRIHEKFGTATWKFTSQLKIDITTARTEYYDYPASLPTVEMSSLQEDLFRRDFTINAMAIQINQREFGKLIDFFHGYQDVEARKIKVLYNLSFVEDPTRILRAVRFEQRFGFEMDNQTFHLAQISVDKIASTSKKRLAQELHILLKEADPVKAIERLLQLGVLNYLVGTNICHKATSNLLRRFKASQDKLFISIKNQASQQFSICYLIILFSNHENGLQLVKQFALNNEHIQIIEEISTLLELDQLYSTEIQLGEIHQQLKRYQLESILCYATLKQLSEQMIAVMTTYLISRLTIPKLIDGNDLKRLNIPPGPLYSEILQEIENLYLNKEISTKKDALLLITNKYL